MRHVDWDLRREGCAWEGDEASERWELTPEKFEMYEGRLFFDDEATNPVARPPARERGCRCSRSPWRSECVAIRHRGSVAARPDGLMNDDIDYRLPRLVGLRHVREHVLWLRFSDGVQGEVDLADGLTGELLEPLQDTAEFAQARIEDGHLAWPNGADWAPESLRDRLGASYECVPHAIDDARADAADADPGGARDQPILWNRHSHARE